MNKILLINEDKGVHSLFSTLSREHRCQLVSPPKRFRNWERILKQVKISVVDVSKKENLETVAEIRKVNPELPIVAFTDRNTPRLENFLRQVGIFFFFLKPFRIREMREILSLSLGEKES